MWIKLQPTNFPLDPPIRHTLNLFKFGEDQIQDYGFFSDYIYIYNQIKHEVKISNLKEYSMPAMILEPEVKIKK